MLEIKCVGNHEDVTNFKNYDNNFAPQVCVTVIYTRRIIFKEW